MRRVIPILLFLATPGWAGIVQHAISDACSATISASGSGNLLVVMCEGQTTYATAVADNGGGGSNSYTDVVASHGAFDSAVGLTSIWYSQTTHSGATTITCTSASSCYGTGVWEISGALGSGNPVDASTGSVHTACIGTACAGPQLTTTNSGSFIVAGGAPGTGITAVAAPYGNFLGGTANGQAICDYTPGTTVINSVVSWTSSNGDAVGTSVAAFLPAAGGPTPAVCAPPFCGVIGSPLP